MEMGLTVYLHSDFFLSAYPADADSQVVSSVAPCNRSHVLLPCALWAADLSQPTPHDERIFTGDASSADIYIAFPAIHNASDSISFFGLGDDAARNADMRFSVDVPADTAHAELSLDIDADRAAVFYITVSGMIPFDSGRQSVDSMPCLDLGRSRERLSAGRMICLLKQQLNL